MLPAAHRLKRADEFRAAFRSGIKAGSRLLSIHVAAPTESHAPRVGFVVSKAVGNAVTRNRVKRRLRAIAAEHLGGLPGADIVVRAQPAAAGASYAELHAAFGRCLRKTADQLERRDHPQ